MRFLASGEILRGIAYHKSVFRASCLRRDPQTFTKYSHFHRYRRERASQRRPVSVRFSLCPAFAGRGSPLSALSIALRLRREGFYRPSLRRVVCRPRKKGFRRRYAAGGIYIPPRRPSGPSRRKGRRTVFAGSGKSSPQIGVQRAASSLNSR